jgi:hypothetical protein
MSEEIKQEEEKKLTPEQLEANRKKVIDYYKKQSEVLKYQAEYEQHLADIETSRARRMEMIIRQAQMQAGPEDPENPEAPEGEKKERKLKKA